MNNKNNEGFSIETLPPVDKPPYQVSQFTNSTTYIIYLNEEIVEAEKYSKLFNLIRNAGEYDVIKIHINSPGGNLFTGVQLITCMRQSMAHIITSLDGMAFSLAPLILLAGDEIAISENSVIMFHHYSSFAGGKGNEQLANATAMNDFYRNTLDKYGTPFLSEAEIDKIMDGKDLYFGDDEINKRIDSINAAYEEEDSEFPSEESQMDLPLDDENGTS